MATWREDTIQALNNLGGVAHLSEIHKEVEKLRKGKLNNTWTQTVQRELETYSSDSEAFGGGKDIFYMAEGKGKGVWSLLQTVVKTVVIKDSSETTQDFIFIKPEKK